MPGWLAPLIAAPFIGSFLGVLIRRIPTGRPFATGRSECESCGHPLGVRDLVPILSFLALRGRCRSCGAAIAPMHLAVEVAALAIAAVCAATQSDPADIWAGCVLGWTLLALGWIDAVHLRLPDVLTLPLIVAGLAATVLLDPDALADHAAAAVLGYLAFRTIGAIYRRLRHREGLGQGDAKLLAAAGAWVGLLRLPDVVLGGAVMGIAFALVGAVRRGRMQADVPIPFGPCLAVAIWLVWLVL
jgi:leader peptidase (prepilin peptidase)/N-methyltransferase